MNLLSSNVFDPDKDIPDLSGKVFIVTGGSAGIGFGICAHLLQHNPEKIYLLSNKEDHADESIQKLGEWGDASKVEWKKCNLEDLEQTKEIAEELKQLPKIDALICNAGLGVGVYNESRDGIDTHMQVNVFAQNLLLMILLPVLLKTPDSRIVLQSSENHRVVSSETYYKDMEEINKDIGPTFLYNRTKLAQILFARRLVKHLKAQGKGESVWINSTHPGGVSTDQPHQAEEAYGLLGKVGVAVVRPFLADPVKQGCKSALYAATSPEIIEKKIQGSYIIPDKKVTEPSSNALNDELAENLWKLNEDVLRKKFGKLPY
ncbi:NAD(P)-binding Rossmann-fold containing protein [Glarea lozoyensis ATCC 20868]|uniref:NAD(P)-binding Rossmann-fold containing protein n=1 Tax=Glarea lozoyensis (strain ATCC 20868 / MF5171) TaxID=1116229 RepID=S3CLL8_GLAL2|nr:NAD(P)-binding Rossmann-fold containing protein [Glarea lozoyensis ATCC 20868]EPE27377.1 NAD(P)-binding Rossmann-fold containing protein [Glarea lozoyensis ATCC 20868]